MAQKQGASCADGGRIDASIGTDIVAGNVAIGAGWGGTATFEITAGSNDQVGQIVITASATTPAQATATIVLTFADGAYNAAPFAIVTTTNTNSIDTGHATGSCTTTAMTITFLVLPVAAAVYTFNYLVVAR